MLTLHTKTYQHIVTYAFLHKEERKGFSQHMYVAFASSELNFILESYGSKRNTLYFFLFSNQQTEL